MKAAGCYNIARTWARQSKIKANNTLCCYSYIDKDILLVVSWTDNAFVKPLSAHFIQSVCSVICGVNCFEQSKSINLNLATSSTSSIYKYRS